MEDMYAELSEDSPDWYESLDESYRDPFRISFVEAGSRAGSELARSKAGSPVDLLDHE